MAKSFRPPKDASAALLALVGRTTGPTGAAAPNVVPARNAFSRASGSRGPASSPGLSVLTPGR